MYIYLLTFIFNMRNNVEISGISNDILGNDLEEEVIGICKDSIVIISNDIEGCHCLPLGRNSTRENN